MADDLLAHALSYATDTRDVVVEAGALASVADVFRRDFGDETAAIIVCDENTWRVAGAAVEQRLRGELSVADAFRFAAVPVLYAEQGNVDRLRDHLRERELIPVAVGAGTVNDIAKRAAHECGRPYMAVATAASVDGYTAFGAAISRDGFKRTLACPAPRAVVADLDVIAAAPAAMTAAGYADLLAKYTAGADWILADELEIEPIDERVWSLVQEPLRASTAAPAALRDGDPAAIRGLIEGLILAGLAMQAHASSRPASGAEHQFSHLWEMRGLGQHPAGDELPLSHGFKVGLATVAIAALYERVLATHFATLDVDAAVAAWPSWPELERRVQAAHASPELAGPAVQECRAKYLEAPALAHRLRWLRSRWPRLRARLATQLPAAGELAGRLGTLHAPTRPEAIGLAETDLRMTYSSAQTIRRRFTVLDLLQQTARLDATVGELFGPDGYWGRLRNGTRDVADG